MKLKSNRPQVVNSKDRFRARIGALGLSSNPFGRQHMNCAHCNRLMNDFDGGYSRGYNNEPLCHPNGANRPDCYKLVTLYKHEVPCKSTVCYEDHEHLKTYIDAVLEKTNGSKS